MSPLLREILRGILIDNILQSFKKIGNVTQIWPQRVPNLRLDL